MWTHFPHFLIMFCLLLIVSSCYWWEATWAAPWQSGSLFGCVSAGTAALAVNVWLSPMLCSKSRNLKWWWWIFIVCVMTSFRKPAECCVAPSGHGLYMWGEMGFALCILSPDKGREGKGSQLDQPCPGHPAQILGNEANITLSKAVPRQGVWRVHYGHRQRSSGGRWGFQELPFLGRDPCRVPLAWALGWDLCCSVLLPDKLHPSWLLSQEFFSNKQEY